MNQLGPICSGHVLAKRRTLLTVKQGHRLFRRPNAKNWLWYNDCLLCGDKVTLFGQEDGIISDGIFKGLLDRRGTHPFERVRFTINVRHKSVSVSSITQAGCSLFNPAQHGTGREFTGALQKPTVSRRSLGVLDFKAGGILDKGSVASEGKRCFNPGGQDNIQSAARAKDYFHTAGRKLSTVLGAQHPFFPNFIKSICREGFFF